MNKKIPFHLFLAVNKISHFQKFFYFLCKYCIVDDEYDLFPLFIIIFLLLFIFLFIYFNSNFIIFFLLYLYFIIFFRKLKQNI